MRLTFDQIEIEVHFLGYISTKPGWYFAPHSHQQYEMHFITKGKGINRLESGDFELYPHVVYMAPPNEIHEQFSDMEDPLEIFFMPFSLTGLVQDLPSIHAPFPFIQTELQMILQLQRNTGANNMFHAQMRLIELIWTIISPNLEHKRSADQSNPDYAIPSQIVERAILYIQNHKLENPAIKDIAGYCHISSRQLSRVFAQSMHSTIHDFIQQERYLWACKELRHTEKTIEDISEDLHLGSKQYFCHWFKSFSMKSPTSYRNVQ